MKYEKLINVVKSGNIVIPLYIYKYFSKLNIDYESFIFLMFLYSKGNKIVFDINSLSKEFFCDNKKIMEYIGVLQKGKLIEIKVIKNEKNIMEEYISLDFFYDKISLCIVNDSIDEENKSIEKESIFTILEKEFGRSLSAIEIEIVKAWQENKYSDEIIKEAIKESVMNGVPSLRYIDKILYTWSSKGIKTIEEVEKNRRNFRKKEENKKVDVFEYDWIDDDES